jgi:hypothetical protein
MVRPRLAVALALFLAAATVGSAAPAFAFGLVSMQPNYHRFEVYATEPLTLVFDQSLDPATVTTDSVAIDDLRTGEAIAGAAELNSTTLPDDTLVFTPGGGEFPWAERLQVGLAEELLDVDGQPFGGELPHLGVFVANIPNDLERPIPDPGFPVNVFVNSNVLLGFNPLDPESTDPTQINYIPGMSATEAWKLHTGDPNVLIAVVDDGVKDWAELELADRYHLNKGELLQPTSGGDLCPDWDCNGDGRFNARDYNGDPRVTDVNGNGRLDPEDVVAAFSDGVDNDGNGLIDDICGWDFFRNVNTPFGISQFREGTHGGARAEDAVAIADNNNGNKPGFCPNCSVLSIRVGEAIMTEYNLMAVGVEYAIQQGADVIIVANGVDDYSIETEQAFIDAYEAGALVVAASGDELGFHHIFPAAGEDAYSVKGVLPIPPVELFGPVNLSILAFVESYCTNFGAHIDATGTTGACSSEATSNIGGIAGLILSYARSLGYDLSPGEVRQLLNMTADDIKANCFAFNQEGCKPGWEQNFGYGRVNAYKALLALGDPLFDAPERIPPDVRLTSPRWWTTVDPNKTPTFDVEGEIYARGRPYQWSLAIGFGVQPNDNQFEVIQTGSGVEPFVGKLATIDPLQYVDQAWLTRTAQAPNDFTVTLRLRAWWTPDKDEPVVGEIRKAMAWRIDDNPDTGLLPGFPKAIGASGVSSPLLYDLDGDVDGALEIVFATALPSVEVYKRVPETGEYEPAPGFPVDLPQDRLYADSVIASAAVGPLFGDNAPYIVVATSYGLVYVVHPDGNLHDGGPFLAGFPVSAAPPDNSTPLSFGHGNAFLASPALGDLDGDGMLEIIAAAYDQHAYAWRPVDEDKDGLADYLPGWPVPLFSDAAHGLVPPSKICESTGPAQVLTTPAVGFADPANSDPDIALHPSVFVGSTETCEEGQLPTSRLYGIYWNGLDNDHGPFLPDWPVKVLAPSGDSLPIPPLTIGITSSPAVARYDGELIVSTGTFFWFPQLVHWDGESTHVETLWASKVNLGVSANGSFGRFDDSGKLWYFYPTVGFLQKTDIGLRLEGFSVIGWRMDDHSDVAFRKRLDDINFFINPIIADLNGDGLREMIAGSGGYLIHALNVNLEEPDGWPKFTQNWQTGSPTVGDLDGDGKLEVVSTTQEGNFFAWKTQGPACLGDESAADWGRFHHDPYNSGFYGFDAFPPNMVRDLEAHETGHADLYSLRFTAPGDDYACGTAATYELRYWTNADANLRDPAVWASASAAAAPDPVQGGQEVSVEVQAPGGAAVFALRAIDDQGLVSPISNLAVVQAGDDDDDDNDDNDSADDDDDDNDDNDDESPSHFDDDEAEPSGDDDDEDKGCGC